MTTQLFTKEYKDILKHVRDSGDECEPSWGDSFKAVIPYSNKYNINDIDFIPEEQATSLIFTKDTIVYIPRTCRNLKFDLMFFVPKGMGFKQHKWTYLKELYDANVLPLAYETEIGNRLVEIYAKEEVRKATVHQRQQNKKAKMNIDIQIAGKKSSEATARKQALQDSTNKARFNAYGLEKNAENSLTNLCEKTSGLQVTLRQSGLQFSSEKIDHESSSVDSDEKIPVEQNS